MSQRERVRARTVAPEVSHKPAQAVARRQLSLHIEELVLDDVRAAARHQVGDVVRQTIVDAFARNGTPAALQGSTSRDVVRTSMAASADLSPDVLGGQIGHAVYNALQAFTDSPRHDRAQPASPAALPERAR
jgi:hypothetical protein